MTFYGSVSTANSVDCITNFRGVVIHSRVGSTVRGTFYHDEKYKYTCPDIKVTYDQDKSDNHVDSTISAGPVVARIWKPQADDFVVDAAKAAPPGTEAVAPGAATADTRQSRCRSGRGPGNDINRHRQSRRFPPRRQTPSQQNQKEDRSFLLRTQARCQSDLPGGIRFGASQLL